MEVDNDGEAGCCGCGSGGCVEAEPKFAWGVDCDIKAFDTIDGVFGRRGFEVEEVQESTVDSAVWIERVVNGKGVNG